MLLRTLLFIITFIISCNLFAQSENQIIISYAKKGKIDFTQNTEPSIEIVNEKLNISYSSTQGTLFQINGLDANLLDDATQAKKTATINFIDLANNYVASAQCSTAVIKIQCGTCKAQDDIVINGKVKLCINQKRCIVKFNYTGKIPQSQFIQTQ